MSEKFVSKVVDENRGGLDARVWFFSS